MYLLMCGLLYRDITLAVFDHDVDVNQDTVDKPAFVRSSIFKLANREGLEAVFDRVAALLPDGNTNSAIPIASPPTDQSISTALRTTGAKPKPRQPPRKPRARVVSPRKQTSEQVIEDSRPDPSMGNPPPQVSTSNSKGTEIDLEAIAQDGAASQPNLPTSPHNTAPTIAPRRSAREHVVGKRVQPTPATTKPKTKARGKGRGIAKV